MVLDDWHAIGRIEDVPRATRLLGQPIEVTRTPDGAIHVRADDEERPVIERYGHVWTTLGTPGRGLFDMPEFGEPNRRLVTCGIVTVKTSPLRIMENFLDLAHFPYVHGGILGIEEHGEVESYEVEHRLPEDEIWAIDCRFFSPRRRYRPMAGKSRNICTGCPRRSSRSSTRPARRSKARMPFEPGREYAVRADATSMAYRRWLRDAQAILVCLAGKYDAARKWYPTDPAVQGRIAMRLSFAGGEIMNSSAARLHDMLGYDFDIEDYGAIRLWLERVKRLPGFRVMPGIHPAG